MKNKYNAGVLLLSALLLLAGNAKAQPVAETIKKRFEAYSQGPVQEKLYLHTDKSSYIAGEIIWLKVYAVEENTHQPIYLSKVAYVELIDRWNKPVLQAKISLNRQGGNGSIYLPFTIASDQYRIRAYTSWMRNEGENSFFEKDLRIVNTMKKPVYVLSKDSLPAATIQFFPEGGQLVGNIESNVAFHLTDAYGKGIDGSGVLRTDKGDTAARFFSSRFGMGRFLFTPVAGRTYKAVISLPDGKTIEQALPVPAGYGYVMRASDMRNGRIKVDIRARFEQAGRSEEVFLVAHTRRSLKAIEKGTVREGSTLTLYINKQELGEGISHLTLFNSRQQPVCERLVFRQPRHAGIAIAPDQASYQAREKVTVKASGGQTPFNNITSASASVFQLNSWDDAEPGGIQAYCWLQADLQGKIESPAFYFSDAAGVEDAADNLMLTHGWRRFRWEKMLTSQPGPLHFLPEYGGHFLSARVADKANGRPAPGVLCYLTHPSSPFGLCVARTDKEGIVRFEVRKYYGPGEVFVQTETIPGKTYEVTVLTPFAEAASGKPWLPLVLEPSQGEALERAGIAMQARSLFNPDSSRQFIMPLLRDTLPFFGRADYTYKLDDYRRFSTIEETLREFIVLVNVVSRGSKPGIRVYDDINKKLFDENILVLLDGVPVQDHSRIFGLDPQKVKKIEVVPRHYIYGVTSFNGIVSFETFSGKYEEFNLSPSLVSIDYEGLQLQREFYSPAYETAGARESRIPDLRTTLYWQPEVSISNTAPLLQFYTSDLPGRFVVMLDGITADGQPFTSAASFTVQP